LTASSRAVSQEQPADAGVSEPAKVERVRPPELIDVPEGMVLRPRDDEGRRTLFKPDQEYKCFATPGWGQMGQLIVDYRWLFYYAIRMEAKVAALEQQIGNLELQLEIWNDNTDKTERALNSMTGLFNKEHDWRLKAEKNENIELWAWRAGTVVGLVLAGAFAGAWGAQRSK